MTRQSFKKSYLFFFSSNQGLHLESTCAAATLHERHGGVGNKLLPPDVWQPPAIDPPGPFELRSPRGHVQLRLALKVLWRGGQPPVLPCSAQRPRAYSGTILATKLIRDSNQGLKKNSSFRRRFSRTLFKIIIILILIMLSLLKKIILSFRHLLEF